MDITPTLRLSDSLSFRFIGRRGGVVLHQKLFIRVLSTSNEDGLTSSEKLSKDVNPSVLDVNCGQFTA